MTNETADTLEQSTRRSIFRRRSVLRAAGVCATLPFLGNVATARAESTAGHQAYQNDARPPVVHPHFGYSGTSDDDVPNRLTPDETVELHVEESKIDDSNLPELTVEFGAFHFNPVGLHVDPGTIVKFDFHTPEHTVTAYHPGQERQQRVPEGVPAFSSPVIEHHGFWLYRFEEEGVYDLLCTPHEWGGMGMRIVVGDNPGDVVREPGRPPLPMTTALLGNGLPPDDPALGPPKMAPDTIVDRGSVTIDDLAIELEVTLTAPTPA
ncbi:cupredoxin domain-containing protein [Haloarchaeobius amylolyticus]|uniref:cupredoxin domain-containing protein n=1 Tax=Haloarchaeobius amylolyticus TaxID=1198296 RepID=UPI002271DBE5|nr:plastocyanin/azurin family copper-binding protein [Haloarchaeobius amylolyticus]